MKQCIFCGSANPDSARFCTVCGKPLGQSSAPDGALSGSDIPSAPSGLSAETAQTDPETANESVTSDLFQSAEETNSPNASYGSYFKAVPESNPLPTQRPEQTQTLEELPVFAENKTRITKEFLLRFYKNLKICGIGLCVIGAIACIAHIFLSARSPENKENYEILLSCGAILVAIGAFFLVLRTITVNKNQAAQNNALMVYRFDERAAHGYEFVGSVLYGESHIVYEKFTQVLWRPDSVCLYMGQAIWILDRDGFTVGTEEQLRTQLLNKRIPEGKYVAKTSSEKKKRR